MKTQKRTNKLCLFLSMVVFSVLLLAKPLTAQAALSAPTNFLQVSGRMTEIQVTWDAVTGATGYDVQYSTDRATWSSSNVLVIGNAARISNLTANTTYYVQVATKDSTGTAGIYSQALECNTAPEVTDASVPVVTNATEKSITVQWAPVTGATGYYIDYGTKSDGSDAVEYSETTATSVTMNLNPNVAFYLFVTPYRTSAGSTFKAYQRATYTYCATAPTAPKNPKLYSISSNDKTLTFTYSATSTVYNTDGYQVEVYSYKNKKMATINADGTNTMAASATKSAFANTPIKFRVRAYVSLNNKKYYGGWSGYQYYVPKATCGNKLKVKSSTSATLTWKKVAGASSYTVYYKPSSTSTWKVVKKNVKGTSATVKYSKYASANYYYVQANSVSFKGKKGKVSSTNPNKINYYYYMDSYRK